MNNYNTKLLDLLSARSKKPADKPKVKAAMTKTTLNIPTSSMEILKRIAREYSLKHATDMNWADVTRAAIAQYLDVE